jgi:hypothetical protein
MRYRLPLTSVTPVAEPAFPAHFWKYGKGDTRIVCTSIGYFIA